MFLMLFYFSFVALFVSSFLFVFLIFSSGQRICGGPKGKLCIDNDTKNRGEVLSLMDLCLYFSFFFLCFQLLPIKVFDRGCFKGSVG